MSEITEKTKARIEEIDDELDELHEQFDYAEASDLSIDSPDEEMELFWQVERLLMEKSGLQHYLDNQ